MLLTLNNKEVLYKLQTVKNKKYANLPYEIFLSKFTGFSHNLS
jgi:hypothetical protein